jgi:hypothetical protein
VALALPVFELVDRLMSNGPHRKRIKHVEGLGHLHELTFSAAGESRSSPMISGGGFWHGPLTMRVMMKASD